VRGRFTGLWRSPDFLKLWAGETVSVFGSFIGGTALQFTAVLTLHATPVQMAVLVAMSQAPALAAGLLAGVWIDRLRRRPILIAADIGRAALLMSIPLAYAAGALRIEQLYAVAFLTGTLTIWFDVAYQSYLPSLVKREDLVEGNSKLSGSASVAEFSGFSLAGWMVQVLGGPVAILIDALSFVWSALFLGAIRAPEAAPSPAHARLSMRAEIVEGMREVRHHPILRAVATAQVLRDVSNGVFSALILLYITNDVGLGPGVQGLIFAVGGVTALLGAMVAGRASRRLGVGPALIVAGLATSLGSFLVPLAQGPVVIAVALLVANQLITDPAWAVYEITEVSLRQAITPERLIGRVSASIRVAGLAAVLVGSVGGGVLGQVIGLRETLTLAVCCGLLGTLVLARSPVRRLKDTPPAHETDIESR
jgi:MFS family permease